MTKKLFKWDIIFYFHQLKWLFAGVLIFSLTTFFFRELSEENVVFGFLYGTTNMISIVAIIVLLVYAYFLVLQRYYKTMLKDEGYLTHTLPVTKTQMIAAKLLSGYLNLLLSGLFGLIMFFLIRLLNWDELMMLKEFDPNGFNLILLSLGAMVLTIFISIVVFYAALSYGFSFNKSEWAYVFLFLVIYYVVSQVLGFINFGINFLINPAIIDNNPEAIVTAIMPVIVTNLIFSVGIGVLCFIITKHYISKKLNLKNG